MLKPVWISRPANWICHVGGWNVQPSQWWKTHGNLPGRSRPPSQFPRSEAGSSWGKIILHPLPLSASPRLCSSQMNYLIRMCDNSLFLLTVAYAQVLQYWVEELNLPENPNVCPLARSVIELRERLKEHVMFTKWDIIQA